MLRLDVELEEVGGGAGLGAVGAGEALEAATSLHLRRAQGVVLDGESGEESEWVDL